MKRLTYNFKIKSVVSILLFVFFGIEQGNSMEWSGKWIWQTADGPANSWVCFRKTINIDVVPENVIANIAVDSKYWLWINGEMVVFEGGVARGPSRAGVWNRDINFTPSNSWYEEVNIKPYLKQGENTIAILVWYWGRETFKGTHIDSDKGGLLFNCDLGGTKIVSDGTWKVKQHPGYDANSGDNGTSIVQYKVKYNAQTDLNDWSSTAWYATAYDDNSWLAAVEKGVATSAPWYNLEKTYVPRLVNHGLKDYENNATLNFPFVSNGNPITCKMPFNMQITPYFEIESTAGKVINVATTLEDVYPKVHQYLALWEMNTNGLSKYRKWEHYNQMDWTDWGDFIDKEPIQVALYYMALESAKK